MGEIRVWATPADAVSKGMLSKGTEAVLEKLDPAQLNASLKKLAHDLEEIMKDVETKGGYRLSGIEVGVEITADAGVNLIGSASVGGKAGLTLRFERDR
jgi:hypothetical protein